MSSDKIGCDDVVTRIGMGIMQTKLLWISGCSWAADAVQVVALSFIVPIVQKEWHLDSVTASSISSAVFIGMLLGATLAGYVSDRFGRRVSFMMSLTMTIVCVLLSSLAQCGWHMIVIQCLIGAGVGGAHVSYSLFTEFLPVAERASTQILLNYFWTGGVMYESINAFICFHVLSLSWRVFVVMSAAPLLLLSLFSHILPETPRFLVVHGRIDEAKRVLFNLANENTGSKDKLVDNNWILECNLVASLDVAECSTPLSNSKPSYRDLVRPGMARLSMTLWATWWCVILGYYGLVLYTPRIFGKFNDSDDDTAISLQSFIAIIITSSSEVIGTWACRILLDKIGRRKSMYYQFFITGSFLCLLSLPLMYSIELFNSVVSRAAVMGCFCAVYVGIQMLSKIRYVYSTEVFPTSIRSRAMGTCSSIGRIAGALAPFIINLMPYHQYIDLTLVVFAVCSFIGCLLSWSLKLETKGRALIDVLA